MTPQTKDFIGMCAGVLTTLSFVPQVYRTYRRKSVGDFSWAGITGTYFWVDPKEKLVTVLMMQVPQATDVPYWRRTRTLVYQTLVN